MAPEYSTRLLEEIRELFSTYFDHPWLMNSIDEFYTSTSGLSSIRTLLSLSREEETEEYHLVLAGIRALREFINAARFMILPGTGFRIKQSGSPVPKSKDAAILKKCITYTLPVNVERLYSLTIELEKALMRESLTN